nr:reverse transcriptase domain-containing protein [Tanacetum cinerariifolium]
MVAYLQKPEGNEEFHQIVDFLNISHIREMEITATIDGKVKVVTKAFVRRHLKLKDSDGISTLPTIEIIEQLSLIGDCKGYTRVDIPLFPVMIVQGLIFQDEGSTVPVESHHTPTGAPSTSPPHISSPPRSSIRQETEVPQPSSLTHTHVADEVGPTGVDIRHGRATTTVTSLDARQGSGNIDKTPSMPYDSPLPRVNTLGSDEGSMTLQELMVLVSTGIGGVSTASRIISTAEELVSTVGASMPVSTAGMIDKVKELSLDETKELFKATMRSIKDFVPMESEDDKGDPKLAETSSSKRDTWEELYQRRSKKQKIGESLEPRNKDVDELSQKELHQLMIIILVQGMIVEALQTKYPIIDWEIFTEDTRKDDLIQLWSLVKEIFSSTEPTNDKERVLWVELNYFCQFLVTLQNLYPMDDEPMWVVDLIVTLTLGFVITIPETANEFTITARMDAMTMKMDAQYKDFHSRSKQSNLDDDDIPMSHKEEGKFMQTSLSSLPSNTQPNPKGSSSKPYEPPQAQNEHVNVVFTRSGKSYDPPDYQLKKHRHQTIETKNSISSTPQKGKNESSIWKIPRHDPSRSNQQMEENSKVPLILGRPTLHTANAIIQVKKKQLNLRVQTERMIFHINSVMKHSYSNDHTCFSINVIDEILKEDFDALLDECTKILHSIEGTILEEKLFAEFDEFISMTADENFKSESNTEGPPFEKNHL